MEQHLFALMLLSTMLFATSCTKSCYDCEYPDGDYDRFCENDFDTKGGYKAYIKYQEKEYGAKCK